MKKYKLYSKSGMMVLLLAAILLGSCTNQYTQDIEFIDGEVAALKSTDIKLRTELTEAINKLHTDMLNKLQDTDNRLNGDIDKQMQDMTNQIISKMNGLTDFLNTEMAARVTECNTKNQALITRMDGVEKALNDALQRTRQEVEKAMNDGDNETVERLNAMIERTEKIQKTTDSISRLSEVWEARLQELTSGGYAAKLIDLNSRIEDLEAFELSEAIDEVKEFLAAYSEQKLEEMEIENMQDYLDFAEKIESQLMDIESLSYEVESEKEDLISFANDLQGKYDDVYSQLEEWEELADALSNAADALNDGISSIESAMDEANNVYSEVESVYDHYSALLDEFDSTFSDASSLFDEADNAVDYLEEISLDLESVCNDLYSAVEDWKDEHPWWDD